MAISSGLSQLVRGLLWGLLAVTGGLHSGLVLADPSEHKTDDGDPIPATFSRHTSVHGVGARQFSRRNEEQAVLSLSSLLVLLVEEPSACGTESTSRCRPSQSTFGSHAEPHRIAH